MIFIGIIKWKSNPLCMQIVLFHFIRAFQLCKHPLVPTCLDKQLPTVCLIEVLRHLNDKSFSLSLSSCSVWQSVQSSVDFTIPLYKWDKSYMQERYYGALRVDPMVRRRDVTILKKRCNVSYQHLLCVEFSSSSLCI